MQGMALDEAPRRKRPFGRRCAPVGVASAEEFMRLPFPDRICPDGVHALSLADLSLSRFGETFAGQLDGGRSQSGSDMPSLY